MEIFDSSDILEQKEPFIVQSEESPDTPESKPSKLTSFPRRKTSRVIKKRRLNTPSPEPQASDQSSDKCRFCLVKIKLKKRRSYAKLTQSIEQKFQDLTSKTLNGGDRFSKIVCVICDKKLKDAVKFRDKLINIQNQLESQLPGEKFENVVVKCEIKEEKVDEPLVDPVDIGTEDYSLFDSTQILDQFDIEDEMPLLPVREQKLPKSSERKEKSDPRVVCPECGLMYANKPSLKKHIDNIHIRFKKYVCDHCGYSATVKHSLKSHMRVHVNQDDRRIHKCDKCDFISVCRQSLRRHKEYEHNGIVFECICGKKFSQKGTLQIHIKQVHEKRKDYTCECGRQYYKKRDLEDHIKMYHTVKPSRDFHCEKCGKTFVTKRQLWRHHVFHTESKHQCTQCEKAYHTESQLKRHMKPHAGNRDLLCHLCDKSYFFNRDLQRHLDVVHKQTIYYCEFCDYTNSRKDYLGNHLRSAHALSNTKERNAIVNRAKFIRNPV